MSKSMRKTLTLTFVIGLVFLSLAATVNNIKLFTDFPNSVPVGSDFFVFQRNNSFINASVAQVKGDWFNNPVFSGNGGIQGVWTAVTFVGDGSQLTGIKTTATNSNFILNFNGLGTNTSFWGPVTINGTNSYGKFELFDANGVYVAGFDTNKGGFFGVGNLAGWTNLPATSVVSGGTLSGSVIGAFTGDVTTPGGSYVTTLATVNANVGTFGDATHSSQVTVNAKGQVTAAANVSITGTPPGGTAGGDLTGTYPNPTLATVNGSPGTFGDGTHVAVVTVNSKGLATTVTSTAITGAAPTGSAGGALAGTYPNPTLANVGTAGTYTKTTFNAAGQETSGTSATLASADFANQGSTTTVLHGNAAGNPSWTAVQNADLANSSVTINGTANQINGGGAVSLGGSLTLSTPQNIDTAANVTFGSVKTSGKVQSTGNAEVNALILTNETVLVSTAWANSPSGAYDMSISAQTYTITAASAITSFSNTRLGTLQNYSEFAITNSGGSDLALTISASGYTENDGLRSFTITNKSQRIIRFKSSAMGVNGISQPFF